MGRAEILYAETSRDDVELTLREFKKQGANFSVDIATTGEECLEKLAEKSYDLVLLDYKLPRMDALQILGEVQKTNYDAPVIIVTGRGDEEVAVRAMKRGAYDYVVKSPNYLSRLPQVIQHAIERYRIEREKARLEEELRKREEKLRKAHQELKKVDQLKSSIITNVSHELLTPITIINGLVDILEDEEEPEERRELIQRITKALGRQKRIVDDLITLSRIYTRKLEFSLSPEDITTTIERAVERIKDKADKKEIKVSTEIGEDITPVYMDAVNIEHVLKNLLDNAVKFSPRGKEVRVTAKRSKGEVVVAVKDEGTGIDPERLEEVFEPLTQMDPTIRRRHGGTGTGLAVAKHIVELHGGKIWAESEGEGKGSTFCFTLPLGRD